MAAPTFTLINHQPLSSADNNTGWNDLTTADTDIKVEGSGSMSGIFRADGEQGYYDSGTAPVSAAGKTVRGWILSNSIAYMGTHAGDPYKLLAYDGTTTELKAIFGSDTYPGGWFNYVWSMDDFTTLTLANVQRWGVESGHASNARNVTNTWMDVIRYLDGFSMVGGTSGDKVTPFDIAALDKTSAYYVLYVSPDADNVFFGTGTVQFGTGATTHYFEMDGDVLTFKDLPIAAGLYSLSGVGSGTDVVIANSLIQSAGTTDATRFVVDFSDADLASLSFTGNTIIRASTVDFKSGQTVTDNIFDDCGQITPDGADLTGSIVRGYEGTTGTAALVYDNTADPNGELDDMSFVKGTATTHAIEFGSNTPSSISLSGQSYSGYNASNGQNDSTIYNNTGGALTINVIGEGALPSYRNGTGASTTVVLSKGYELTNLANPSEVTILDRSVSLLDVTGTEASYAFGSDVTFTGAGQSFQVDSAGNIERIRIKIRKVGSPTDGVYVRLVNGVPGSTLISESVIIDAADMTTSFIEFDIDLNGKYALATSTTYGIEFYRTGAISAANYYQLAHSATSVHASGTTYVDDEGTWGTDSGDLLFSAMDAASDNELHHVEAVTTGSTTYTHGGVAKEIEVLVASIVYKQVILIDTIGGSDKSVPVLQIPDLVYYNPS